MNFAREAYSAGLVEEMRPLFKAHHDEVGDYAGIETNPDFAVYERLPGLRLFTAREDGRLEGLHVVLVYADIHTVGKFSAAQDFLYLKPEARRGFTAVKFLGWCDDELKAEGVSVMNQSVTPKRNFGAILNRLGYEQTRTIYSRRLCNV